MPLNTEAMVENTSVMAYNMDNTSSIETKALVEYYHGTSHTLLLYVTPVILFGGTIGNLMTIVVILSHHFRCHPSSVPLITMAFVDIGVLYFNLLDIWLGELIGDGVQYTRDSPAGCKISTFITVFLTHCSSWILVLINAERVVSVYKPLKARTWCTRRRQGLALLTIMLVLGVINVHIFWTVKFFPQRKFDRCQYDETLLGFHGVNAWLTIDATLFVFMPFVLILASNVYIIYSLIKASRRRKSLESFSSQNQPNDNTRSITFMLITISIVFLITTSPLTVCYQFYDTLILHLEKDPVGMALWYDLVINTVFLLLCYSNNALNFLLYCISGSKFREALSDVCARRRRYRRQSTVDALTVRSSIDYLGVNGGTPLCKRKLSDMPNRCMVYYPKGPKKYASSPEIRMLGL